VPARASPITRAVASAVPLGASAFPSWWSSITSAASKNRAASAANRISTAPSAKLGATMQFASPPSARLRALQIVG
jgi:hypothetical protein